MHIEVISHTPTAAPHPTPLLFVHGAWHAAWCWEHFLPYFAQQGYASYALSLRGHGKSEGSTGLRWYSSGDYVADVADVVKALPQPPVLIGHSMGGYIVQKYLETNPAPASVLLASVPVAGILGFAIRYFLRHPWAFLKAQFSLNPWHMVATPALMTDAFFSPSIAPEEQARHFSRIQPESFRLELDALALALPRPQKITTPLLVLAAANDHVFSIPEAQATARAYHTNAVIFPDMAHDMMLESQWKNVADHIIAWLQEHGI